MRASSRAQVWRALWRTGLVEAGAGLAGVALQLAAIYLPAANAILGTQPLTAAELAFCVGLPAVVFFAVEVEKWLVRRGRLYRTAPAP